MLLRWKNKGLPQALPNTSPTNNMPGFQHWKLTVVILLCLVSAGFFLWRYTHKPAHKQPSAITKLDDTNFSYLKVETRSLGLKSQYDQAAKDWSNYAMNTTNSSHKNTAYINAANAYINEHQYANALSMCKKAEAIKGVTYDEAQMAAIAARNLGDKKTAIYYYQQALRLVPDSLSDPKTQKYVFSLDIKQLQESK